MNLATGIRIRDLHKRYPRSRDLLHFLRAPWRRQYTAALQGVDLSLPHGGIYALLGPNGAGKTTLLKILAGMLLPNEGRIEVGGEDLAARPARLRDHAALAICDERSFYWRLSGRENLRFFASLNGLGGSARDDRIDRSLQLVGLADLAERRFMEYSSGMRQALALARALLLDPAVLLMDEPTRSLDPEATSRIHAVITGILAEDPSRVILYSTHDLAEAEAISSDVIVLRNGRVVTQRGLTPATTGAYTYGVRTSPVLTEDLIEDLPGVQVLGSHDDEVVVEIAGLHHLDAITARLRERGLRIVELTQKRSSLRELYRASAEEAR